MSEGEYHTLSKPDLSPRKTAQTKYELSSDVQNKQGKDTREAAPSEDHSWFPLLQQYSNTVKKALHLQKIKAPAACHTKLVTQT